MEGNDMEINKETWNKVVVGYAMKGKMKDSSKVIKHMEAKGIEVALKSYNGVKNGFSLVDKIKHSLALNELQAGTVRFVQVLFNNRIKQ